MPLRKYAHGEVSDVSGTQETMADVETAPEVDNEQPQGNDTEGSSADSDDYNQSN
jgi:hypothetical protein